MALPATTGAVTSTHRIPAGHRLPQRPSRPGRLVVALHAVVVSGQQGGTHAGRPGPSAAALVPRRSHRHGSSSNGRDGPPTHPPSGPGPGPGRNARRRDQARHKALMVPCGRLSLSSRCLAAPRTLQTVPRRTPGLPPRTPNPTGTAPPVLYYPRAPRTRPALRRHRARRHPALWMAGDIIPTRAGLPAAWSSGGPHTCNARVPRVAGHEAVTPARPPHPAAGNIGTGRDRAGNRYDVAR